MFLNLDLPELWGDWLKPIRYKIAKGGRGGGKSMTIARLLVAKALQGKFRIVCGREIQKSIKESVHYTLCEAIESLQMEAFFEIGKSYIKSCTGSEFLFVGLRHNTDSIKSMGGIDLVWIEESEQLSLETWIKLDPTIRAPGSEIWFSYNPEDENSTMNKLATNPYDNMLVTTVNWSDNKYFPIELEIQRQRMLADPDMQEEYQHIWEGKPKKNMHATVLYGKWASEWFEPNDDVWNGPYFGTDWGFSHDPVALTKSWIHNERLYIEKDFTKVQLDIDATPQAFRIAMPESVGHIITADSSSPGNISYMKRNGYPRMIGAKKPKNSVKDGIARLRGFDRIIIHPNCVDTILEARLWSWKVDRLTNQILNELKPGNDHCWDSIRYATEKILLAKKLQRRRSGAIAIIER